MEVSELAPVASDGHPFPSDHTRLPWARDIRGLERDLVSVHVGELLLEPHLRFQREPRRPSGASAGRFTRHGPP